MSESDFAGSRLSIVYGPADGYLFSPLGLIGMFGFTAAKNGMEACAMNVGSAFTSLMVSVCPLARTPLRPLAFFSLNAVQPTTNDVNANAGDARSGCHAWKNARANAASGAGEALDNHSPVRTANVYVLP